MNNKSQYNTKQHAAILDYLRSIKGEHATAAEVYKYLCSEAAGEENSRGSEKAGQASRSAGSEKVGQAGQAGNSRKIGKATVYRQLERLVEEGLVDKYVIDQNTPACFEYIGSDECGEGLCVHGKCLKCGKLFHLHCDEIVEMQEHLIEHHGFTPDFHHTVIYGICEDCK